MIFDPDTLLALLASPLWFIALWGFWKLEAAARGSFSWTTRAPDTAGPGGRLSRGRLDACLCPVAAGALPDPCLPDLG
ncbi:hypothetical protein LNQ52_26490 [Klebsiella pneumoniae subsp. pneumoniae]|nr:hypothetical protein [Klebsiella pneumoniae subsp. pneumoniae]